MSDDTSLDPDPFQRSALSLRNALKQGFLLKEGGAGLKKHWQKRWFILHDEYLYYFPDDAGKKPKGVICLSQYSSSTAVSVTGQKHAIKLSPNKEEPEKPRTYLLGASKKYTNLQNKYGAGVERVETSVFLRIGETKMLESRVQERDWYCQVLADRALKGRSPNVYKSENPVFNQEFEFTITDDTQTVLVQVLDQKKKKNQVIGRVIIPLAGINHQKLTENWHPMLPGENSAILSGKLKLQAYFVGGHIRVMVLEGQELTPMDSSGSADPFIVITYGTGVFRSSVVKKTLNPKWKEDIAAFPLLTDNSPLLVEVFDAHKDGTDDFMGEVVLPMSVIREANGQAKWYELKDKPRGGDTTVGELRIAIQLREAVILPDKMYDDLFALLMADNMTLTHKLAAVAANKERPIAEALVKCFEMRRSAVHYIKSITSAEINATNDPNIIFRGNTVGTKSVDMYMRLVGIPYLHYILKPVVSDLLENSINRKKSCEMDPLRLDMSLNDKKKAEIVKKNQKILIKYVETIWTAIQNSFRYCPANFRYVFEHIQTCLKTKFDPNNISRYTGISGFIFLRFFCPALLTPKNFGLLDEHPPAAVSRDLTLIAKVLQNMANLVSFGKKEPYLVPCNEYIESNRDAMKAFIDKLASQPTETVDEIPSKRDTTNFGREMSRVHFHLSDALDDKFGADEEQLVKLTGVLSSLEEEAQKVDGQSKKRAYYNRPASGSAAVRPQLGAGGARVRSAGSSAMNSPRSSIILTDVNVKASLGSSSNVVVFPSHPPQNPSTSSTATTTPSTTPAPGSSSAVSLSSSSSSDVSTASSSSAMLPPVPVPPAGATSSPLVSPSSSSSSRTSLTAEVCPTCSKEIEQNEPSLLSLKRRFHEACFKCSECQNPIRGPFVNNNGVPRCLSCQPRLRRCAKCSKEIQGSFLHIANNAYHHDCFTCHLCGVVMGTNEIFGYVDPKDPDFSVPICGNCHKKEIKRA